jgi:hypothetical protein
VTKKVVGWVGLVASGFQFLLGLAVVFAALPVMHLFVEHLLGEQDGRSSK